MSFSKLGLAVEKEVSLSVNVEPNQSPQALFTIQPLEGDTETIFSFDPSQSLDKEDPSYRLRARWDFENDGIFDTDWLTLKEKPSFHYTKIGKKEIKLEVIDTGQKIGSLIKELTVKAGPVDLEKSKLEVLLDLLVPNETDATKVIASLKDKYDNPIEGKKVDFFILEGDGYLEKSSKITSEKGTAEIIYTVGGSIKKTVIQAKTGELKIGQVEIKKKVALISFYTSPFAKIKIYDNEILIGESKADEEGFFIFDCSVLSPGIHQIKIVSVDEKEKTSLLNLSLDTKEPISLSFLLSSTLEILEGKDFFKFSGYATPFVEIFLYIESPLIKKTETNKDGFWEVILDKEELTSGIHKAYAIAKDKEGRKSQSSEILEFEFKKGIITAIINAITDQIQKVFKALPQPIQETARAAKKAILVATQTTAQVAKAVNQVRENPVVQNINKNVVTPVVGVGATINVLPIISTILLSDPLHLLLYFLSYFGEIIGIRKKRHPWGKVYDSLTKEPLPFSTVRIFEKKTNRLFETHITDRKGRFGFLVVPGEYYLLAQKANYIFPSQKIKERSDEKYADLYHGETLEIKKEEEGFIKVNIPLDSISIKKRKMKKNILRMFLFFLEKIGTPLLVIGTILAGISLLISIRSTNIFIFLLYLGLLFAKKRMELEKRTPWGKVYDGQSKRGIELAQIQLYDKTWGTLLESQTTDRFGRFGFLIEKEGDYFLKVVKENYVFPSQEVKGTFDKKYRNLYHGEILRVEKGKEMEIRMNIPLDKKTKL